MRQSLICFCIRCTPEKYLEVDNSLYIVYTVQTFNREHKFVSPF